MYAPLNEADYESIISTVIKDNPFVSGNNGGFGLCTPSVPYGLSLISYIENEPNEIDNPLFCSRKRKHKQRDELSFVGTCSPEECLQKKYKSAYQQGLVVDLTHE